MFSENGKQYGILQNLLSKFAKISKTEKNVRYSINFFNSLLRSDALRTGQRRWRRKIGPIRHAAAGLREVDVTWAR